MAEVSKMQDAYTDVGGRVMQEHFSAGTSLYIAAPVQSLRTPRQFVPDNALPSRIHAVVSSAIAPTLL